MKYWLLISVLVMSTFIISTLILSTNAYAEKEIEKKESIISKEKPEETSKKKKWPPTFVPSEKISADSSVSFPADI